MSRMEKINEQMKREIGTMIQSELQDPRLKFVTITHVEVSRDLRQAKVSFSVLGDAKQTTHALNGLNSARGLIRKWIGKHIRMRFTPELEFIYDNSLAYGQMIEEKLV